MNKITIRVLVARPIAFSLGTGAAALVNPSLQSGAWLLLSVGLIGGLSLTGLALWWLRSGRGLSRHAVYASPVISLLGWGTLATFTGGLESPFIAAIFFEIALAVVSMGPRGVIGVVASSLVVLVLIESPYILGRGRSYEWQLLLLEMLFVGAIGGLGVTISGRREAGDVAFRIQGQELGQRLDLLQRQLEDERVISRVGENVARLAHGLKNAVHSLRGFVALIEPQLNRGAGTNAAMAGLRAAIDDLEKLARMTLAENGGLTEGAVASARAPGRIASITAVVEAARRELNSASPDVRWSVRHENEHADMVVGISENTLLELLVILMRNAVEAMAGRGHGTIETGWSKDRGWITVRDEGVGFAAEDLAKIFQPGFTTKERGSGFGLFLARRIVEDHGGVLELAAGEKRGAVVRVELPLVSFEGAD